ncbi:MAG TPA: hypothetical protein VLM76_02235 [Patescibacteria group bacterium]|nr:hypothetical protein [Patescibacteria group bacterium]
MTTCPALALIVALASCAPLPCLSRDGDPVTVTAASPSPVARPSVAPPRRTGVSGIASTYGPGWDGWLALPAGPGIRVRICGAGGCAVRTSNDAGPDLAMQRAGRIADLDVPTFEYVCGVPWRIGLCHVTVETLPPP